jgi:thymidylate synthase
MEVTLLEARDLDEAWYKCLKEVLWSGHEYTIDRGSFEGHTRKEFDLIVCQIRQPWIRPLIPVVPEGCPVCGDIKYVESDYLYYLLVNDKRKEEDYRYGQYMENQYFECIKILQDNPNTNQACCTIGDKDSIYLKDPPCMKIVDWRVRDDALHWIIYFRSWDLYSGWPTNLAGLQLAKEQAANEIGVDDGELIAISKGLHLYDFQFEYAKQIVMR